jgi:hypothetical protein
VRKLGRALIQLAMEEAAAEAAAQAQAQADKRPEAERGPSTAPKDGDE